MENLSDQIPQPGITAEDAPGQEATAELAFTELTNRLDEIPPEKVRSAERIPKWKASGSYDHRLMEPIAGPPD